MVAIRAVAVANFRGFTEWSTVLSENAVVVGEPGAGRSDLIEAIVRVLDPDYLRTRHGDELDFHNQATDQPATVEVVVGDLGDAQARALAARWEWWDATTEQLITQSSAVEPVGGPGQERVARLCYRLTLRDDGQFDERVYWPKSSDPSLERYDLVRQPERAYLPFFWQRGLSTRPLDLAGRGELRNLIERQAGEPFDEAVKRFVEEVSDASARFSNQDRVKAALEEVLSPLRQARRFRPDPAETIIRFLPDGGAPSGLLRTLTAAISMVDGPEHLPAVRHGATVLGALRAGALIAAASGGDGAIVAVDDFGGEFDPHLAADIARQLRTERGQAILATRTPSVIDAFPLHEILRVYTDGGDRKAARGPGSATKTERISAYYYAGRLTSAVGASAVVIVDGVNDRLALQAVERRATGNGMLASLAAAGITYVDAGGTGEIAKVATAASSLGLYSIALLDNDQSADQPPSAAVAAAVAAASVSLWLPPRRKLEWLLVDGVPDPDLVGAVSTLAGSITDMRLPDGWDQLVGPDLQQLVIRLLHGTKGSIHAAFVEALDDAAVSPTAIAALDRVRTMALERTMTGLVQW